MKKSVWVKHVISEGSRRHVIWWDRHGPHCSEPNCEVNATGEPPKFSKQARILKEHFRCVAEEFRED